jgi:hypothetical protein
MAKTLFEHLKAIYENQSVGYFDSLDEADRKTFQPYMINRMVSMVPLYVPFVNAFQSYGVSDARTTYLFYSQLLPKGKQFSKYVKGAKFEKYEAWMVELIANHFSVSKADAETYIEIYQKSLSGKAELRSICEGYGTDPKLLKKADLDV